MVALFKRTIPHWFIQDIVILARFTGYVLGVVIALAELTPEYAPMIRDALSDLVGVQSLIEQQQRLAEKMLTVDSRLVELESLFYRSCQIPHDWGNATRITN